MQIENNNEKSLSWYEISRSRDGLYETPKEIAKFIYNVVSPGLTKGKSLVFDPTAGGGRLLKPFYKNKYLVYGVEFKEEVYNRLKHNITKKYSNHSNIEDFYHKYRYKFNANVFISNPPFGLRFSNENYDFGYRDGDIESQTAIVKMASNILVDGGIFALIIPSSTWTNNKDKELVRDLNENFNVFAKITVKNAFKKEYGITKETDIVIAKRKKRYSGSWADPYKATRKEIHTIDIKDLSNFAEEFNICDRLFVDNYNVFENKKQHEETISEYISFCSLSGFSGPTIEATKLLTLKDSGISGNYIAESLIEFYNKTKISAYSPLYGRDINIKECYFSLPAIINDGIDFSKKEVEKIGFNVYINENSMKRFRNLKEKWDFLKTPIHKPKSHELLAYYQYNKYKAMKEFHDKDGKLLYKEGEYYTIKPMWYRTTEAIKEEEVLDKNGKSTGEVEITSIDTGYLRLQVNSENGMIEYSENDKEKIAEFLEIFELPDIKGISELYPQRVEAWANYIAKNYPSMSGDYIWQAEELSRILCKPLAYIGLEMGGGKCVDKNSVVYLNGDVVKISDLYYEYVGDEIAIDTGVGSIPKKGVAMESVDSNGRIRKEKVKHLYREKVKTKLNSVTLVNGNTINITKAHKLLTATSGWTNKYSEEDYIAIPNKAEEQHGEFNENLAVFLGWQISEGYEHNGSNVLAIDQKEEASIKMIQDVFNKVKEDFNLTGFIPRIKKNNRNKTTYSLNITSKQYRDLCESIGMRWGVLSKERHIPRKLMQANNNIIAKFLSNLFEGDGYVCKTKNVIEYTSASLLLIKQIQYLLLRFGILSIITKKMKCATNGKRIKRPYYYLKIGGSEAVKFKNKINFVSERKRSILESHKATTNNNVFGIYVQDLYSDLIKYGNFGASFWGFTNLFTIGYSDGHTAKISNKDTIKRVIEKIEYFLSDEFKKKIYSNNSAHKYESRVKYETANMKKIKEIRLELIRRINSDITFIKIKSITEIDYDDYVYDLEIENTHNFMVENTVAHNTLMSMAYAKARQYQRVLVVCQGSLVENWINEAKKFGFKATALKTHNSISRLRQRVRDKDFKRHETEFFIIGQEFLSLDGGRVYDTWTHTEYDEDGEVIFKETSNKGKIKRIKYENAHTHCPQCDANYNNGWSGRFCSNCGYRAFTYGKYNNEISGMRQYPAYKNIKKLFSCVITDESQNFAARSLRGEASRSIKTKSRLLLTGTIMKNYIKDVFINFGWVLGYNNPVYYFGRDDIKKFLEEFGSYEIITKEYLNEMKNAAYRNRNNGRKKMLPEVSNINRFWKLISPFTIRKRSNDIKQLREIPRERRVEVLGLDAKHATLYEEYHDWAKKKLNFELSKEKINMGIISDCLWKLRYIASCPANPKLIKENTKDTSYPNINYDGDTWNKIKYIEEYIENNIVNKDEKLIIFSGHRFMQSYISRRLTKLGYSVKVINAGVKTSKRFDEIKDFENNYDILVTGNSVLNRGYTIIGANHIIAMDPEYTPEVLDQAEFRCIRPGQDKKVFITHLLSSGTIDEEIRNIADLKRKAINSAIDKNKAEYSDIKELLEQADYRNPELAIAKKINEKHKLEIKIDNNVKKDETVKPIFEEDEDDFLDDFLEELTSETITKEKVSQNDKVEKKQPILNKKVDKESDQWFIQFG